MKKVTPIRPTTETNKNTCQCLSAHKNRILDQFEGKTRNESDSKKERVITGTTVVLGYISVKGEEEHDWRGDYHRSSNQSRLGFHVA